jgi:hypothetical protein
MRLLFVAILAISLTACASAYKADLEGKPSARVRMVSTSSYFASAGILAKDCAPSTVGGWTASMQEMASLPGRGYTRKRESIGMPVSEIPEYASFVEQRIAAGVPITLAFRGTLGNAYCNIALVFTPQEGGDYEALFAEKPGGRVGICTIAVSRLRAISDGKAQPVPAENVRSLPPC